MPVYQNVGITFNPGPVTLVTTTEAVILDSGRIPVSMATMRAVVTAVANVQMGTGGTLLSARIRKGSGISAPAMIVNTINTTAGWWQDINCVWSEQVLNNDFVEYTFTLAQQGASTNGSVVWGALRVDLING